MGAEVWTEHLEKFLVKLVVSYLIEFIFTSHKNQNTRAQPDWNVSPQKTQATIDKAESKKEKIDTHPINEVTAKQKIKINFVFILMGVFDPDQLGPHTFDIWMQ